MVLNNVVMNAEPDLDEVTKKTLDIGQILGVPMGERADHVKLMVRQLFNGEFAGQWRLKSWIKLEENRELMNLASSINYEGE